MKKLKLAWVQHGLKIKIGEGKSKKTIKIPLIESIILGFGLVEGYLMGGFTGGLIGLAIGGVAILTGFLAIIPFVGQYLYHIIMMYTFSVAHVNLTNTYVVGFIYTLFVSFLVIKETAKFINERQKQKDKAKNQ